MAVNLQNLNLDSLELVKSNKVVKLMMKREDGSYQNFQFSTAKMYVPFGVKTYNNQYSSFPNCHIDCSLNQAKTDASLAFRELLKALDFKLMTLIKENQHLFAKDSVECDMSTYSQFLRDNNNYPELMKLNLPRDKNGNFSFFVFNENREKVMINDANVEELLKKGIIFKGIVECSKVWYYNGKYGSQWNLVQLKLEKEVPKVILTKEKSGQTSTQNSGQNLNQEGVAQGIVSCIIDDDF
jgi:hypothetical protein